MEFEAIGKIGALILVAQRTSQNKARSHQEDEDRGAEPREPIAGPRVERTATGEVYVCTDRHETVGHCRRFRDDTTAIVADG